MPPILRTIVIIAVGGAAALAQTTQGLISGRVIDTLSGRAIPNATIHCESFNGGVAIVAHSGSAGYFVLPLLSPTDYRLRVEAANYQAQEIHQVVLPVAGRLDFQFRLRELSDVWESGQYRSVFLPNSEAILTFYGPDVDTSRSASFEAARPSTGALESSISQVVDPSQIRDLPLAGRDIYTTLVVQPGVTAGTADARGLGLSISGARPTSSTYLMDGVENNNYLVSGPLTSVAPESVQEYRISTNNFSAEYGGTVGAVANAVTRGGGGQWHGLAYFYIKNDALNASDFQRNCSQTCLTSLVPAALPRSPLHEIQPGFQAGGPILKNRLFTSTSFQYLRTRGYGDPFQAGLPTTLLLSQAVPSILQLLQQHPFPLQASSTFYSLPVNLTAPSFADQFLGLERLDYAFPGGKHRLTGRVAEANLGRPDFLWSPYQGFDAPLNQNTISVVGSLTSAFSPTVTNEARVSFSNDSLHWNRPYTGIPTLQSTDGTFLPGSPALYAYRNRGRSTEIVDDLVWAHGRHLIQFGGGVLFRGITGYLTDGRDGLYAFSTVAQFGTSRPFEFSAVLSNSALPGYQLPQYDRSYRYNQFHLFAQDTFRATSRFTVNYGVRYDHFGAPTNTGATKDLLFVPGAGSTLDQRVGNGRLQAPGSGDEQIYSNDNRGWAARLGASYDLTGKGRTVLRGAYGIFYDRPFDNLWSNVQLNGTSRQDFLLNDRLSTSILTPYATLLPTFPTPVSENFPKVTWVDPSLRNAYAQSFFLGVRQEITSNLSLEVNGTASLGRKLITTDLLNRGQNDNPDLAEILYRANQGSSNYNALTALLRYRTTHAYFQAAYTWSHSIDNQSSPIAGDFFDYAFLRLTSGTSFEAPAMFTVEQNSRLDRGSSDFDQRHNLVISSIVDLPSPGGTSKLTWLARDWRFAALASFRSGFPYTVYNSDANNDRANLVQPGAVFQSIPASGGLIILNQAAFAPANGNGNLGRNSLGGPGLFNIDLSLNRSFHVKWLGEAGRLNLRADAFNFLNHANLNNPDPVLGDDSFGLATYGRVAQPTGFPGLLPLNETARQIQLMLRIEW